MGRNDIFEDIVYKLTNCQYISDLRHFIEVGDVSGIIEAVKEMNIDDYSVQDWNELYSYLFKENSVFQTSQDAYLALIDKLYQSMITS